MGAEEPYTTFKDNVITLGAGDACFGDSSDPSALFYWEDVDMTGSITLKIGEGDTDEPVAETVILSWNETPATSNLTTDEMTGEEGKDPAANVATWSNGYSIMIMRWDKAQSNGENLTIDGTSYKTIKVSNGAQNKLILPKGKVTKKITLYSYVNVGTEAEAAAAYWKEVAGKAYTIEETGMSAYIVNKVHQGIDKYEFTFDATNEVTFTNAGKQCCYVIAIEVEDAAVEEEPVAAARRWDFTTWSDATVANLIADAAQGVTEGWSDVEKNGDTAPTETSKDNCFWSINTPDEIGGLSANNVLIDELKGLKFGKNVDNRGLAIAVNYPVALSTYAGGAYLWLGGANKEFFTIPAVAGGSTIKMGVESHKDSDARGVDLLVNGTSIGQFTPKTYEEYTWTVPAGEAVDVVVDNTNGCHIYFIEVEQDQEALLAVATADLQTVIAAAEAIEDLSIYTEESVQALNAALTAAKAAEGTIKAQTEAAYALLDAKAALQKSAPDPDPVMMTYKVNEVAGDIVFRTTEGEALEGTDVKVAYRLYNADENGKLYKKGAISKEYKYSFKLTEEGQVENIEYEETDVENVIFLAEGEDIEGLTPITTGNASSRSSNSAAGHADEDTEIVTLTAGTYTVHVVMYDKTKPNGEDFIFKAGDQEFAVTPSENFSEGEFELELTEATALILGANSIAESGLDAIYIVKTGDVVVDGINTINAEAENGAIYNLQGQKVQNVQKGIYIIGGKKVAIK